ncbi:uncharacterized protein [Paramisgurnus dabryanus]|uniref:uncharacterized protein n=1 Tax=Paramisgurnus dabryanus TaxID=90735 RepID=UPI0031F33C15
MDASETKDPEQQVEAAPDGTEEEELRRSGRQRNPTEKMRAYIKEEALKKEKKLLQLYEQWKELARDTRKELKKDVSESQLVALINILEKGRDDVMQVYLEIRDHIAPSSDTRRRIDTCEAVTKDISKIIFDRMACLEDFEQENVKHSLRELLHHDHARSVYGSTVSCPTSSRSTVMSIAAKRADAAAELAAKEAEYSLIQEIEARKCELEKLKVEKDLKAARARLQAYDQEMSQEVSIRSSNSNAGEHQDVSLMAQRQVFPFPVQCPTNITTSRPTDITAKSSPPKSDIAYLAQAVQDSIALNRLPTTEPSIFTGDPIQFIEWKAAFVSLIHGKAISSADKLHYLKRYVGGPARKSLDGIFYRNDDEAYNDAWNKLNQRYGQPFVIQKAFREKLSKWPKIQSKDAEGFREFSDFLNACHQAMPHVKGLEILNDCDENQKLVHKLPDWAAARWNRQVTQTLIETHDFPKFIDFVTFMSMEAEITCNPVTSFSALRASDHISEKWNHKDSKRNKANVFHIRTATEDKQNDENEQSPVKGNYITCLFCKDRKHKIHSCSKFLATSLEEKRKYVKENKLCYGCMKPGHAAKDCRHRLSCDSCKGRHPTCLHDENYTKKFIPARVSNQGDTETTTATSHKVENHETSTNTSMIVPVWVSTERNPGSEKLVYALLDTQSDTVFIERELSNKLHADSCPVRLKLTTMTAKDVIMPSERVSGLKVRGYNSSVFLSLPPAYTKDSIPVSRTHIPTCDTARHWKHLSTIVDKIPPLQDCEVGLLIGYSCPRALAPKEVILGGDDEPYAIHTDLGWSVVGRLSSDHELQSFNTICHRVSIKELPPVTPADVIKVLESDFKDDGEDNKTVSQDDILFLTKLQQGIRKNDYGHYEMPLPFRARPHLPNNKQLAILRLDHLKRKLLKDERYKEHYVRFMEEVIEKGDAEEVYREGKDGENWYIPHHGVYHPKKPDKLRVVFDCSAKYQGTSLNNHLLQGPDLMNNLTGVLVRFRQHPVALMCDVEKMFHQFHVEEADRNYLCFLWWKNGNLSSHPQEYRMKVHLFGATSSPGCANYGLKHLAKEYESMYPLGSKFITTDFYVDDGVTSVASTEEAVQVAREARQLCALGGLRLHKFISNDRVVLDSIPVSERAVEVKSFDLNFDDTPLERALGIHWHIDSDRFRFSVNLKDQPATRRGILSTVASLYDPLGFIAPFLLNGKLVLQEMCRNGTGWDDPLPEELQPRWELWKADLVNLERIDIPRCYAPANFGKVIKRELHHFSDASNSGYGQCSYLRLTSEEGNIHCALVIGKSRVAPIKIQTIPRLELTAAVISVAMSKMLKQELKYADIEEHFWTDSQVVLGYINNEARRFHTFVANRVQKIHLSTNPQQWRYVPTTENPADHASRGLNAGEILTSNWLTGPSFLWKKDIPPVADIDIALAIGDPEVRQVQTLSTETTEISLSDRLLKLSSWSRAVQAVARLVRRAKGDKSNSHSTVAERENAKCIIIKDLQRNTYPKDIKLLSKGAQLSPGSKLYRLDAFLDQGGVLKVGGRLCDATLPNSVKHPAVIPKDHHVTKMIISQCHVNVKHQGKGLTINEIRSQGYWIPGMNRAVASHVHHCVTCRKLRRPTEEQRMADLPSERTNPSPPFTYCGMDCFGPFITKQSRKEHKRYGLLFTCFSSRAIHIEMLNDMSTDAFINGLRCFIALRGAVREIKCDQGTNFVGAKNELKNALKEIDEDRLTVFLAEKQCDFVLNAPHSSHAGGIWERQIRTVRNVLRSTLSLSSDRLDDASLRTFFYEAMAIVNSRPLSVDNLNDPNSLAPLTPNNLLTMKSIPALPPPGRFLREDIYARKRWRHVQYLAEQFWSRWRKEYLSNIATRQRWHTAKRNLQVGDIVMEKADNLPRNEWRLARVTETTTDKDGLVRRVKICLGDRHLEKDGRRLNKLSVIERPVQKLILLLEAV